MAPTGALPSSISIKMNNTKHSLIERQELTYKEANYPVPPFFFFWIVIKYPSQEVRTKNTWLLWKLIFIDQG